jgi:hypothetical protein
MCEIPIETFIDSRPKRNMGAFSAIGEDVTDKSRVSTIFEISRILLGLRTVVFLIQTQGFSLK